MPCGIATAPIPRDVTPLTYRRTYSASHLRPRSVAQRRLRPHHPCDTQFGRRKSERPHRTGHAHSRRSGHDLHPRSSGWRTRSAHLGRGWRLARRPTSPSQRTRNVNPTSARSSPCGQRSTSCGWTTASPRHRHSVSRTAACSPRPANHGGPGLRTVGIPVSPLRRTRAGAALVAPSANSRTIADHRLMGVSSTWHRGTTGPCAHHRCASCAFRSTHHRAFRGGCSPCTHAVTRNRRVDRCSCSRSVAWRCRRAAHRRLSREEHRCLGVDRLSTRHRR